MAEDLIEPLKAYKTFLKDKVKENAIKYFDDLVSRAGVNVLENNETVKTYRDKRAELDKVNEDIKIIKRIWKIILIVVFCFSMHGLLFILIGNYGNNPGLVGSGIGMSIGFSIAFIVLLIIRFTKVKKRLQEMLQEAQRIESEANKLLALAYSQMAELNALYDWNMPATIINMSNELFHMDPFLDPKRFEYLYENYGLEHSVEENVSTTFVQSGDIYGNPFMICKDFRQDWIQKTYTGSITIHWTTTVSTKNGTRTVHHTQTLTAEVVKPAPIYQYVTYLLYGNEAAPNLTFSRSPSNASGKDDKKIKKIVAKEVKRLDKKAEKELLDGDPTTNYTRFGNDEFESLYGGTDRNNELEYRLLFTPLAQKNLLELIKDPKPYGDDWYFDKEKMLNYVQSRHSQGFNYMANPDYFIDYCYEDAKKRFVDYMELYFQSFYYDLLPVISIPLYQMHKSREYIYKDVFKSNVTSYEQEVLANTFNRKMFAHPDSDTDAILKVETETKNGKTDIVKITAHSFKAVPHTDYINKVGGDGHVHTIPVDYYIYEPLEKDNYMAIGEKPSTRRNYLNALGSKALATAILAMGGTGDCSYQRGLFAYVLTDFVKTASVEGVNKAFTSNNTSGAKLTAQQILDAEINAKFGDVSGAINQAKSMLDNSNTQKTNASNSNPGNSGNNNTQGSN